MWMRSMLALLLLSALSAAPSWAQGRDRSGVAGRDLISFGVFGGGFSPAEDLMGGPEFDTSGAVGGTVTLWVQRYVGIRGNVLYAQTELQDANGSLAGEDPNVWAYGGELVLRLPAEGARAGDSWFPYVVGGLGAKTYDFDEADAETDFAGSFGGGIEYRYGRIGLQAEVRDFVSQFDQFGFDDTQHDVVYTAGLTLNY